MYFSDPEQAPLSTHELRSTDACFIRLSTSNVGDEGCIPLLPEGFTDGGHRRSHRDVKSGKLGTVHYA